MKYFASRFQTAFRMASIFCLIWDTHSSLAETQRPAETATVSIPPPTFHVAEGLDQDGSLIKNYQRGLQYAIDYFGNYGPYHIYLLGPDNEESIRQIYRERAITRVNPKAEDPETEQIRQYLKQTNVVAEIEKVLKGEKEGGLTWTRETPILYEDVTTNASQRAVDPIENTWGALHEYHHVFQISHCDTFQSRSSDLHINSWMAEGMATYSSAKFMANLGLIDFEDYMHQLLDHGGNIGRPGINEFLSKTKSWDLEKEIYWEQGNAPQVYYMIGAWATAYLIHVRGVEEKVVLRDWYLDIPRIGKSASFRKHMGLSLEEFYPLFSSFLRRPDDELMKIFEPQDG